MNAQPEFEPCEPSRWFGRYARIPGDSSVFHLKNVNGRMWPTILWQREAGTGTCPAFDGEATRGIADAVMDAKIKAGGSGGGSFIINEYGQVLVPASDGSGRRYIVGELKGRWLFENPFDENEPIDLGDSEGLGIGDPWERPYVGFPFNLSARDKVYFNQEDEEGRRSIYPDLQDFTLMLALRSARSSGGPIRFIVNPFGVVLTKRKVQDPPEERWQPVYVGKVIYGQWFDKEN
ncbi:hypothetical protein [Thioalkalivibrio sp. HK1]|uniref:hypothetical protein n=1 Tax=Thioalkalivibrio sp. HK1 TaxID=1469245 RepID=UPI0004714427|nr:hypothetical protein [Thioalkalivibrio sp. HK1]